MELVDGHDFANAGVLIEDRGGRVMVGIKVAQTGFGAADELRVAEHDQRRGGIRQDRVPKLLDRVIWLAVQQLENEKADQERTRAEEDAVWRPARPRAFEPARQGRVHGTGPDSCPWGSRPASVDRRRRLRNIRQVLSAGGWSARGRWNRRGDRSFASVRTPRWRSGAP